MSSNPTRHPLHTSIISFYDARAPTYDSEPDGFHAALAADFVKWADAALDAGPGQHIRMLDLACGTGLVSFAALEHFGGQTAVHGVDISPSSVAIARQKAAALGQEGSLRVRFWEGSAAELGKVDGLGRGEVEREGYDIITCCSAFVLLPGDRSVLLKQWARYLRPGGVIIFDVPAPGTQLVSFEFSRILRAYGVPTVEREWVVSQDSVREVMREAGLDIVDVFETRTYTEKSYVVSQAEQTWDRMMAVPLMGDVSRLTEEQRHEAKGRFVEIVKDRAGGKEIVKDEYKLMVGIARKSP